MQSTFRHSRTQTIAVILLALVPLFFVAGTNFIVDPLQIYRQQRWAEPRFWKDQRSQNAGKIRSYLAQDGYDSIILGNSVADNFRPSEVAESLGWQKTLKLTVDGGTATEQAFILRKALDHGRIKHVLWCIRPINVMGTVSERWHPKRAMPFYLYSSSFFDDEPYILNLSSFVFSWNVVFGKNQWEHDLDRLNYWQSPKHIKSLFAYNAPANLKKFHQKKPGAVCEVQPDTEGQYPSVDSNILQLIHENPNVEFLLLFSPNTRQNIAIKNQKFLTSYFGIQRYVVEKTKKYPNVKVFGFENEDMIVNNLANYRDSHHYHSGVNKYMLEALARGDNRLTSINIASYIAGIIDKLCLFEVYSNFKTIIPLALPEENEFLRKISATKTSTDNFGQAKVLLKSKKIPTSMQ